MQDFILFSHQLFLLNIHITKYDIKYIIKLDDNGEKFYEKKKKNRSLFVDRKLILAKYHWHKLILSREITVFHAMRVDGNNNIVISRIIFLFPHKFEEGDPLLRERKKKKRKMINRLEPEINVFRFSNGESGSVNELSISEGQSVFRRLRLWYEIWLWEHYRGLRGIKIHISFGAQWTRWWRYSVQLRAI